MLQQEVAIENEKLTTNGHGMTVTSTFKDIQWLNWQKLKATLPNWFQIKMGRCLWNIKSRKQVRDRKYTIFIELEDVIPQLRFFRAWNIHPMEFMELLGNFSSQLRLSHVCNWWGCKVKKIKRERARERAGEEREAKKG